MKGAAAPHPGYRPCAGVALVNASGEVFVGRRLRERGDFPWQMPQGGIDEGEDPLAAAVRELYEETNVRSATLLAQSPAWVAYDLPDAAQGRFRGRYRGQTQRWHLFRFEGEAREIDIARPAQGAHPPEFEAWRWARWDELADLVVPFKREVYAQVVAWFAPLAHAPR